MLLHELLEDWLKHEAINKKTSTYIFYKNIVKLIFLAFPNKDIKEVTVSDCQNSIHLLFTDFNYSKSTLKSVSVTIRRAFSYAKKNRYIDYNPAIDIDIPKNAKEKEITALSKDEQKVVENYCKRDKYGLIILFYLYTSLRASELMNLKWKDYNKKMEQ